MINCIHELFLDTGPICSIQIMPKICTISKTPILEPFVVFLLFPFCRINVSKVHGAAVSIVLHIAIQWKLKQGEAEEYQSN